MLAVEFDGVIALRRDDAFDRREEVGVPHGAAKLAVGDGLQPRRLLQRDDVADASILLRPQLRAAHLAARDFGARVLEVGRPQQAAHVIGAERRSRHGVLLGVP